MPSSTRGEPKDPPWLTAPGVTSTPWVVWMPLQCRSLCVVLVLPGQEAQAGPHCWGSIPEHPGSLGPILGMVTG